MFLAQMMRYGSESAKGPLKDGGLWRDHPMMWAGGNSAFVWVHLVLGLITWLVFLAVLIALARWLWFKGNKEKKGS